MGPHHVTHVDARVRMFLHGPTPDAATKLTADKSWDEFPKGSEALRDVAGASSATRDTRAAAVYTKQHAPSSWAYFVRLNHVWAHYTTPYLSY